ncbi:MAG: glycosyl hydrolase family 18 protein [Clostridiaceae bacterium]
MVWFRKKFIGRYFIILVLALMILVSIFYALTTSKPNKPNKPKRMTNIEISAWVAYWNGEQALEELPILIDNMSSVQAFGAIFDESDKITFPSKYKKILPKIKSICNEYNKKLYLTIVNDRINEDESITQKDSKMLKRILLSKEKRDAHISEIVGHAKQGGYNGVEIDYEKIDKDTLDSFSIFIKELYSQLKVEGIELRIILEPNIKLDKINLPEGPNYLIMAYNLYGNHSGPGPKADIEFIKKLSTKMDNVPGKKWMAFSTGGFDWKEGGNSRSLTEKEAVLLAKNKNAKINRDEASGAVYFQYIDEDGTNHFVWYADEKTLELWVKTSKECGYENIAFWKLGGNEEQTLKHVQNF